MKIRNILPSLPEKDRETFREMGLDLKHVLLRPFLILLKIPANLLDVLYQGVCLYSVKIPQCAGRLLLLPLNLLISLCEKLSFGQVRDQVHLWLAKTEAGIRHRLHAIRGWSKRRRSTRQKLKLYRKAVLRYSIAGSPDSTGRVREAFCYLFAFLLQSVSFFTTYAGLEMYFGGVFFLAPFLITLVIQGSLYTAVVTVFRPGRHRLPMAICMAVFACASILFSYTGLITLCHSPADDYTQAFESYEKRFRQAQASLLETYTDQDQALGELEKALNTMENQAGMARKEIQVLTARRDSIQVPPQFSSRRSVSVEADGTRTTTTVPIANSGYQEALDKIGQIDSEIAALEAGCQTIGRFLEAYPAASGLSAAILEDPEGAARFEAAFSQAAQADNQLPLLLRPCLPRLPAFNLHHPSIHPAVPDSGVKEAAKVIRPPASSLSQRPSLS